MTGGTGFVGRAMQEHFVYTEAGLNATLYITSRNVQERTRIGFGIYLIPGTAETCKIPDNITHVIHLEPYGEEGIFRLFQDSTLKVLYASSGAAEACDSNYARAKLTGEYLCHLLRLNHGIDATVARLWSFVGPHLPLDSNYAIGNFIRDGLNGGPIIVKGDGEAVRSYMYTTDLAEWMWTILLNGRAGEIYNVGSENAITTGDLAQKIALALKSYRSSRFETWRVYAELNIDILNEQGELSTRYVPDTSKTRNELGLTQKVGLDEAIARTIEWNRKNAQT
jgi:dTDP-glucose 4,6-dehydratase